VTASLIALAGERAVLYDLGATITSQRSVGRSPRKPFLATTTIARAGAAPARKTVSLGFAVLEGKRQGRVVKASG
jgi:hypothetical protein